MISFCKNCGKPLKIKEEWGIKFGICNCGFKEVVRTLEFQDKQNQEKKGIRFPRHRLVIVAKKI